VTIGIIAWFKNVEAKMLTTGWRGILGKKKRKRWLCDHSHKEEAMGEKPGKRQRGAA
jgi:hypothetical protein